MTKTTAVKNTRKAATVLTRDIDGLKQIKCPNCDGMNGSHRLNQSCDFCGFFLNVKLYPDHERYVRGLGQTVSGRDTYDIGDLTADKLRSLSPDEVIGETAKALSQQPIEIGLSVKLGRQFKSSGYTWSTNGIKAWLSGRYEGRNNGMVRMNCGNVLRAAVKREKAVAETTI